MSAKNIALGECKVCSGEIVESTRKVASIPDLYGPSNSYIVAHENFHCKNCGILYFFVPKKEAADE